MTLTTVSQLEIMVVAGVVHLTILAYGLVSGKELVGTLAIAWACFAAVLLWGQIVRRWFP